MEVQYVQLLYMGEDTRTNRYSTHGGGLRVRKEEEGGPAEEEGGSGEGVEFEGLTLLWVCHVQYGFTTEVTNWKTERVKVVLF